MFSFHALYLRCLFMLACLLLRAVDCMLVMPRGIRVIGSLLVVAATLCVGDLDGRARCRFRV